MIIRQSAESLLQISEVISRGGVIAFRTDTFYGLGVDPFNVSAVQKIKQLKGREDGKPILIVISDREHVSRFVQEPSAVFQSLAAKFWPGPLTLIGRAQAEIPNDITSGTGTVGLRLPDDDEVRALVRACGGALTATSANPSGNRPAATAQEVENYFANAVDLIVDGGAARTNRPSTVVDVTGVELKLIREGVIEWAAISTSAANLRG